MALAVLHELLSYDLDIALWRPSRPEEERHPYGLADLIRVADPAAARDYRSFSATSAAAVQRGTAKLAGEFRTYGTDLADQAARANGARAWTQRDFAGVVAAYSALGERLSKVERGRLRYARDRL